MRLAARSDEYLRLRQPERPRVLDIINQQRGGQRARDNVESIDQQVAGKILISSFISAHPEALVATARDAGASLIEDADAKAPPLIAIEHRAAARPRLQAVRPARDFIPAPIA